MYERNMDGSLSSFSDTISYFIKLIQTQNLESECRYFLYNLIYLETCVLDEFNQAVANDNIATQHYITHFSKKLEKLKNVVETSTNDDELNNALDDIMTAVETPINIGERLVCAIAGIAGAVVGAISGTVAGAFSFGLMAAGAAGAVGILLAIVAPATYLFLVIASAAVGILMGTVIGIMEGAKLAYQATNEKMKTHHCKKIEDTTIALFKVNKHSNRYNSRLFFPKIVHETTEEKNINPQMLQVDQRIESKRMI